MVTQGEDRKHTPNYAMATLARASIVLEVTFCHLSLHRPYGYRNRAGSGALAIRLEHISFEFTSRPELYIKTKFQYRKTTLVLACLALGDHNAKADVRLFLPRKLGKSRASRQGSRRIASMGSHYR